MTDRRNARGSRGASSVGVLEPDPRTTTQRVGVPPPARDALGTEDAVLGDARPETMADPLYPVALLKIAMAMKRLDPREELHFERLLDDVLSDLVLDRDDFRRYLDRNMGRLMAAVQTRGY